MTYHYCTRPWYHLSSHATQHSFTFPFYRSRPDSFKDIGALYIIYLQLTYLLTFLVTAWFYPHPTVWHWTAYYFCADVSLRNCSFAHDINITTFCTVGQWKPKRRADIVNAGVGRPVPGSPRRKPITAAALLLLRAFCVHFVQSRATHVSYKQKLHWFDSLWICCRTSICSFCCTTSYATVGLHSKFMTDRTSGV